MALKINDILSLVEDLSYSQGFYSRLWSDWSELRKNDPDKWNAYAKYLEGKEFNTNIDFVKWLEEEPDTEEDYSDLEQIITEKVAIYDKSDHSESVYIYDDLAYIGEDGYNNMVAQIKDDYKIKEDK